MFLFLFYILGETRSVGFIVMTYVLLLFFCCVRLHDFDQNDCSDLYKQVWYFSDKEFYLFGIFSNNYANQCKNCKKLHVYGSRTRYHLVFYHGLLNILKY